MSGQVYKQKCYEQKCCKSEFVEGLLIVLNYAHFYQAITINS